MQREGEVVGDEGTTDSRRLSLASAIWHEKTNNRNASRFQVLM